MRIPVPPPTSLRELRDTLIQLGQEVEEVNRSMGDRPTEDQLAWFNGMAAEHARLTVMYDEWSRARADGTLS